MCVSILAGLLVLLFGSASAAVLRVEKDGTGDFRIIQDAVEASAAGDTIRIGPGRYTDKLLVGTPPWQKYTRVLVNRSELTLIGAGAQVTIIGDDVPLDADHGEDMGVIVDNLLSGGSATIYDIGFENVYFGVYLWGATRVVVDNCRFSGNYMSVFAVRAVQVEVENVNFESVSAVPFGGHLIAIGPGDIQVSDSAFAMPTIGRNSGVNLQIQAMTVAKIGGCQFVGGALGVVATLGMGMTEIHDCVFDGQDLSGINHSMPGGTVRVRDTKMRNQNIALESSESNTRWEVERLVVETVQTATMGYIYCANGYIRESHLAKGLRYVVMDLNQQTITPPPNMAFDMTNNWWGTSSPDSIQAWIFDGADQPGRPYYFVDWNPFRSDPLPVLKKSLGGVKALFR